MEEVSKFLWVLIPAFIGYLIAEYQNRIIPFCKILGARGDLIKKKKIIEFDKKIIADFSSLGIFSEIEEPVALIDLDDAKEGLSKYKSNQNEILLLINSILEKIELNNKFDKELIGLLNNSYFENRLRFLLYRKKIITAKIQKDDTKKEIDFSKNKDNDGEIIFEFPDERVRFGESFDTYPYLYSLHEPFLVAISQRDNGFLKDILLKLKPFFSIPLSTVDFYYEKFDKTSNENSQWAFLLFLANNSTKPFIIGNNGKVQIKNLKTKEKAEEDVYLVEINENEKGKTNKDFETDIVIKPGESMRILILTTKTQNSMPDGKFIRETFEQKKGTAKIILPIYRIGITTRSKLTIRKIKFENIAFSV